MKIEMKMKNGMGLSATVPENIQSMRVAPKFSSTLLSITASNWI